MPEKKLQTSDPGDLQLIDEMLALTPEERLGALEETVRSLEALCGTAGTALPTESRTRRGHS